MNRKIKFRGKTFEVAINRKRNDTEVLGFYLSRLGIGTKYEVIGNIYDNKEDI